MSSGANKQTTRVILVGRTGLDGALRLDQSIELARAKRAVNAVAELAHPLGNPAPSQSVIIVAQDAEPEGELLGDFLASARRIDPSVRVLRAHSNGTPPPTASRYDDVIDTNGAPERLREQIHARPSAQTDQERHASAIADDDEVMPLIDAMLASGVPGGGDEVLVRALLKGHDIIGPAMALIRARTGVGDVAFMPGEAADDVAQVCAGTQMFGALLSNTLDPLELSPHAGWLAWWMRLAEQSRQLREFAFTDPLTGAWNRRYFDRFCPLAIEQTRRNRGAMTVLVFDLDDFKYYNDSFGHAEGDAILRETVALLQSVVRPTDKVCRIGGDEFAVIFYEPEGPREPTSRHPDSVAAMANRFKDAICKKRFPKLSADAPGSLSVSGGLATFPWDGTTAEELLSAADQRAMASKKQGKNIMTFGRRPDNDTGRCD